MPAITKVEETLLNKLEDRANHLKDANGDAAAALREVVSDTALVLVAMARNGGPTWQECSLFRTEIRAAFKGRTDWKTALAVMIPACATIFGVAWKFLSP